MRQWCWSTSRCLTGRLVHRTGRGCLRTTIAATGPEGQAVPNQMRATISLFVVVTAIQVAEALVCTTGELSGNAQQFCSGPCEIERL